MLQLVEDGPHLRRLHARLEVVEERVVRLVDRLEAFDVALLELDRALEMRQEEPEVRRPPRLAPDRLGHHGRPGGLGAKLERHLARLLVVAARDPDQARLDRVVVE